MEFDRLVASVGQKPAILEGIKVTSRSQTSVLQRPDLKQLLQAGGGDLGLVSTLLKQEMNDYNTFTINTPCKDFKPQSYRYDLLFVGWFNVAFKHMMSYRDGACL